MWSLAALIGLFLVTPSLVTGLTDAEIQDLLNVYNVGAIDMCNALTQAGWDVSTNIGQPEFLERLNQLSLSGAAFDSQQLLVFADINPANITDPKLRRQIKSIKNIGASALEQTKREKLNEIMNRMSDTFNKAVICPYENTLCDLEGNDVLRLDPDIEKELAESTDYKKLQYLWEQWHDKSGAPMRQDYAAALELNDEAAKLNGFKDATEEWQSEFEDLNFDTLDQIWDEVKPLYDELHTFVRNKMTKVYNNDEMRAASPNMPAHILGNMWAQSWMNVAERVKPYDIDDNLGSVTEEMLRQNMNAQEMFQHADEFFVKIGLPSNAMSFDPDKADIVDPMPDRQIDCHPSAWDFCKDNDFRIKMCTKVNLHDFQTIHHEMGHIAYYQQYAEQPPLLRASANPAFHEAVGDAISLCFSNAKHLRNIGLLKDNLSTEDADKREINALFFTAMDRVAFLPFGLLIDKWRWEVFNGTVPQDKWNERWWQLRQQYQKIVPPSTRTEEHFDPGSKYHVADNSPYISYFFAHLLQFQIYRSLCIEAGEYNPNDPNTAPLHQCVYYGNPKSGEKLMAGMRLGKSEPWPKVLELMTGETTMNGGAIKEYFAPLYKFLRQANRDEKQELVRQQLVIHSAAASGFCNQLQIADWNVATDLRSEAKKVAYLNEIQKTADFAKNKHETIFKDLHPDEFDDIDVKRQVMFLNRLGINILPKEKLEERQLKSDAMQLVYNEATVCPFNKRNCSVSEGMPLNPDIEAIMASSEDFDELKYVWSEWYDNTGTHMRADYKRFIELSNEAAVLDGFNDYGDMLRFSYEDENLQENMMQLWSEVEPLYDALHTYVRHSLIDKYGDRMNKSDSLIPAHLLGNMWAQSWVSLYESIKPFKNASEIDVTESMKKKFTVLQMFEESDRFYTDLGLKSNKMSYTGELPIIEKPEDRLIVCHASAWDFCDGEDYRIKQCTQIQQKDFVTVHHEMGHIQYYIQYADQPLVFRKGGNPGFHEAVGDLMALSVSTPQHLQKIGLLEDYKDTEEDNINALLKMALERVAFMPFGLVIDMYRWELFSGAVPENQWNARWEQLREKYQKIRSPVPRSEANFDAGAKFHVASDVEYMIYFIAHILEFQLHKSMCEVAGQLTDNKPLHKCDIDGSRAVGERLSAGLSAGASRHWSETLEVMTGDRVFKSDAMLEYFEPLFVYLKEENARWERENESPTLAVPVDDEALPLVPIIVGSVLGGCVVISAIAATIYYACSRGRKPVATDRIIA